MIRRTIGSLVLALPLLLSSPVLADPSGAGAVRFKLGGFFPMGHSEFWDITEDVFTLDVSDLNDWVIGAGYVAPVSNNLEIGFNVDYYESAAGSAQRGFVDSFGFPVLHDTRLQLLPLTIDLRFLPTGRFAKRGSRGQYSVRKPVPYFGGGVGANFWEYEEVGDFVDTSSNEIFFDRLQDSGTAFEVHALAGIEFPVSRSWDLFGEARYSWSEATPGGPFDSLGQGDLDLSGWALYFGGSLHF